MHAYAGIWNVAVVFRGFGTSIAGIIPYAGAELGTFYTIRDFYSDYYAIKTPSPMVVLTVGAFSSFCGQVRLRVRT